MSMRIGGNFSVGRSYRLRSNVFSARYGIKNRDSFGLRKNLNARIYAGKMPNALDSFKGVMNSGQLSSVTDNFQKAESTDYNARANQNLTALTDACEKFNTSLEKKLKAAGIPTDISFEFDYDINADKAVITSISDEKYRDQLQSVLDKMDKTGTLDYIGKSSNMLNGNIAPAYYNDFAAALQKCFGQDISKLYIDKSGNIGGANTRLQKALSVEKYNRSFDAQNSYGFPSKQLGAMIKRFLSEEGVSDNVSHMGYDGKGLYTDDGDIRLGTKVTPSLFKDGKIILRAAFASKTPLSNDYDLWLKNEDLFD